MLVAYLVREFSFLEKKLQALGAVIASRKMQNGKRTSLDRLL